MTEQEAIERIADAMRQQDFEESGEDWIWAPAVYQRRAEVAWNEMKAIAREDEQQARLNAIKAVRELNTCFDGIQGFRPQPIIEA